MAEIFGAVASGAGLVSLAVQLAESSQKLKALLKAYRDAPEVVVKLSYELETMLQILRQLRTSSIRRRFWRRVARSMHLDLHQDGWED